MRRGNSMVLSLIDMKRAVNDTVDVEMFGITIKSQRASRTSVLSEYLKRGFLGYNVSLLTSGVTSNLLTARRNTAFVLDPSGVSPVYLKGLLTGYIVEIICLYTEE